eukprot:TRINITY_DN5006_c0_g1_i2.p1 TRINITY_DN5006_c0_g1~~TRINITY_DN5006_c0_g1_i2.p1  ORF type:complete len:432 (+),score=52.01 TRINITY_DN5006_c0_g1_i2:55-1350(+)
MARMSMGERDFRALEDTPDMKVNCACKLRLVWVSWVALSLVIPSIVWYGVLGNLPSNSASSMDTTLAVKPSLFVPTDHLRPELRDEPLAKHLVRYFDLYLMTRGGLDPPALFSANVRQWLHPDFTYETVGFPSSTSLAGWADLGEEASFRHSFVGDIVTQCLFFGQADTSTTTSYLTTHWKNGFRGVPAPNKWINMRVTDFYLVTNSSGVPLILYNYMLPDWADIMRQNGRMLVTPSSLEQGLMVPPSANDGVPAPLSLLARTRDHAKALGIAEAILHSDWGMGNRDGARGENGWNVSNGVASVDVDAALLHPNFDFYGPYGIGHARGLTEYREHVLAPYHAAFALPSVHVEMRTCEGNYCGIMGHINAVHVGTWLGLLASGRNVSFRFCMHWRTVANKAREGWAIFDLPGFFEQIGRDFFAEAASMSSRG